MDQYPILRLSRRLLTPNLQLGTPFRMVMTHTNRTNPLLNRAFIPHQISPHSTFTSPRSLPTPCSQHMIHTNTKSNRSLPFIRLTIHISHLFRPVYPPRVNLHPHTVYRTITQALIPNLQSLYLRESQQNRSGRTLRTRMIHRYYPRGSNDMPQAGDQQ